MNKKNQPITKSQPSLKTDATIINIVYHANGQRKEKNYDFLVVACDPRNLESVCNFTPKELTLFNQLQNFTFHTTLIKIPRTSVQKHGVIFAPEPLDWMNGSVYGFRNESAKKFGLDLANTMSENLVTVYQLDGPREVPLTSAQFEALLMKQLPQLEWWPFGLDFKIENSLTTPYFNHYSESKLRDAFPWRLLDIQGNYNTLYVHASTCFESVLDCWGYANLLMAEGSAARQALPANKSASIGILGAGVSGLLFRIKLKRLGYANIEILESTERYGGKTHTIKMDGPYPAGSNEPTFCELGTCYMSPAYKPMIKDLQEYLVDNKQIEFGNGTDGFRAIATKGQLPPNFNCPPVMGNSEYILRKAEAELGLNPGYFDDKLAQADLLLALTKYLAIHVEIFGFASPMPSSPPKAFLEQHSSKTFIEFLRYHKLEAIIGILQYGYEVQGYGTLNTIPAFYGLIWISPPIIEAMIADAFNYNIPIVTAWSKGWGDLWTQIVTKEQLNITYSVEIESIIRRA